MVYDIYIYIYIYMCVCVCVCIVEHLFNASLGRLMRHCLIYTQWKIQLKIIHIQLHCIIMRVTISGKATENREPPRRQPRRHWWHRMLSGWQSPVPPATTEPASPMLSRLILVLSYAVYLNHIDESLGHWKLRATIYIWYYSSIRPKPRSSGGNTCW